MPSIKLHNAHSIGIKVDDLELLSEFRVISQIWKVTTAKQMKIDHIVRDKIVAH